VSVEELAFLGLAAIAVGTAMLALLVRELVHTILWISVFFVALSGIYFLLEAPFLGVLQLGVYAGAVTILLLFGVMVTRKRIFSKEVQTGISPFPFALAVVAMVVLAVVAASLPQPLTVVRSYDVTLLSTALFQQYGAWLVLLGMVMLSALAGAIYLVREGRE
jgi:NADH-quinone oxidoreductase subunit J